MIYLCLLERKNKHRKQQQHRNGPLCMIKTFSCLSKKKKINNKNKNHLYLNAKLVSKLVSLINDDVKKKMKCTKI